ncbi:MAG: thermonuclease family protein [Candidatus Omnitrophota bacterium]
MRKMIFRVLGIFLALVTAGVFATTVLASSEGPDKSGGGTDRKTGESHSPQSSTASSATPALEIAPIPQVNPPGVSFITDIIDGDKLLLSTGEWVQLLGVDMPGSVNQASVKEATAFIKKIKGRKKDRKKVRLEYYVEAKDRYNRTLAYVYRVSDELLLIAELTKQGESRAYVVFPLKHMGELKKYDQAEGDQHLWLYKLTPKSAENEAIFDEIQSLTEDQKNPSKNIWMN